MSYDRKKAYLFILASCFPKYDPVTCGNCALAVRKALGAGGLEYFKQRRGDAYQLGAHLLKAGFKVIDYKVAKPGDVMVFSRDKDGKRLNQYGHVQMLTPVGWVSDFKQRDPAVFGDRSHWYGPTSERQQHVFTCYSWP